MSSTTTTTASQQAAGETPQQCDQVVSMQQPVESNTTICSGNIKENDNDNPQPQQQSAGETVQNSSYTATTIATNGDPPISESARPKPQKGVSWSNDLDDKGFDDDDDDQKTSTSKPSQSPPRNLYQASSMRQEPKEEEDRAPRREYIFVLCAGVFMAFNSGFVNGSCLSGFVVPERSFAVSSFTQTITLSCLELADGNYEQFRFLLCMFLSFMFGSFISGVLSPDPTPFRIEPMYGPSFLIGAAFLVISSIMAAVESNNEDFVFYFAAAANGIQNGVSSIYSENLIRSTGHSGATTDISLFIAQLCRGNMENTGRLLVLCSLLVAFWSGGVIAYWWAKRYRVYALLINAGLFVLVGGAIIAYLVYELGISVKEAFLGSWRWKKAIDLLQQSCFDNLGNNNNHSDRQMTEEERLNQIFDRLDLDQSGDIDSYELLQGLKQVGIHMTQAKCDMMLSHADIDGNGSLSREEWFAVARACQKKQRIRDIKTYSKRHMHHHQQLRDSTSSRGTMIG
ncbi:membrAne [Seminavis robusta]|uniref:MembrAne n=1 Tax=Seminavis robusta TaxID=568900 RepID=A0A9N8H6Y1_9STRA|nr:membrAne [Seminavis robusta]|eukprot:Sro55_g032540.1 membrAne (512) ;mRNA; f:141317-142852